MFPNVPWHGQTEEAEAEAEPTEGAKEGEVGGGTLSLTVLTAYSIL